MLSWVKLRAQGADNQPIYNLCSAFREGWRALKIEIRETRKHVKLMRDDATLISKRRVNIINVESDSCYVRHETVQKNDIRVSINFVANIKTVSILGPVGWKYLERLQRKPCFG